MADRYALVIGISKYSSLRELPNAVNDAEAIAQLLEKHGKFKEVKRYPCDHVEDENRYVMKSVTVNAKNLWQRINAFVTLISNEKADGFLFIGSHGLSLKSFAGDTEGYIASSGSNGDKQEAIPFRELNKIFMRSNHSSLTVLLDCCHAGLAINQVITRECVRFDFGLSKQYAMLAACRGDQQAYERGEHSVFARAVLDALKAENANQRNQITFSRLSDFVNTRLIGSGQSSEACSVNGPNICLFEYPQKPALAQQKTLAVAGKIYNIQNIQNANFNDLAKVSPITKLETKLRRLNYRKQDNLFEDFLEQELKVGAFWLRHDEDGGQRWLLNRLWREKIPNTTDALKFHLKVSKRWQLETIWDRLGSHYGIEDNPEAIADHLYTQWSYDKTITLVLYGVERLSRENCQILLDQFWQPLVQKTEGQNSDYPLLLFLVDTGIKDSDCCPVQHCCEYDADQPEVIIDLPLENLKNITLKNWMNTHAKDLLPEGICPETAIKNILDCNQRPEACVEEVLMTICDLFGYQWQDIEAKFSI